MEYTLLFTSLLFGIAIGFIFGLVKAGGNIPKNQAITIGVIMFITISLQIFLIK